MNVYVVSRETNDPIFGEGQSYYGNSFAVEGKVYTMPGTLARDFLKLVSDFSQLANPLLGRELVTKETGISLDEEPEDEYCWEFLLSSISNNNPIEGRIRYSVYDRKTKETHRYQTTYTITRLKLV
ncbi:MAG: hypothetical protein NT141_03970 [candidate division WWE3 bacterium]|nr:hypothetical protein [candidate division WWE3 bacterium]